MARDKGTAKNAAAEVLEITQRAPRVFARKIAQDVIFYAEYNDSGFKRLSWPNEDFVIVPGVNPFSGGKIQTAIILFHEIICYNITAKKVTRYIRKSNVLKYNLKNSTSALNIFQLEILGEEETNSRP